MPKFEINYAWRKEGIIDLSLRESKHFSLKKWINLCLIHKKNPDGRGREKMIHKREITI